MNSGGRRVGPKKGTKRRNKEYKEIRRLERVAARAKRMEGGKF